MKHEQTRVLSQRQEMAICLVTAAMLLPLWLAIGSNPVAAQSAGEVFIVQVAERHHVTTKRAREGILLQFALFTDHQEKVLLSGVAETGNRVDIEQEGSRNRVNLIQLGTGNLANVHQTGSGNLFDLLQSGTGNESVALTTGDFNRLYVQQKGRNNLFSLVLEGSGNLLELFQHGDENHYERSVVGNGVVNESVRQLGNGNRSIQTGLLSGNRSASILQQGSGLEVIIRHNRP